MKALLIRIATPSERTELERLQMRASPGNVRDRDALLAHPNAVELSAGQISRGKVFVSEYEREIAGSAAVEPSEDGDSELNAMFVDPRIQRRGIEGLSSKTVPSQRSRRRRASQVLGNPHAERFYLACGSEMVGTTRPRFGPGLLVRRAVRLPG